MKLWIVRYASGLKTSAESTRALPLWCEDDYEPLVKDVREKLYARNQPHADSVKIFGTDGPEAIPERPELPREARREATVRRCPFCGCERFTSMVQWHARSCEPFDAGNTAELTEYQCRDEDCRRAFWA